MDDSVLFSFLYFPEDDLTVKDLEYLSISSIDVFAKFYLKQLSFEMIVSCIF